MAKFHEMETTVRSEFIFQLPVIISDDLPSGDVFYLSAAGQPIIVLNTQKVAADLLDRRAGIYSDRPRNIVAAQIMCGGLAMVFQNYGTLCVVFFFWLS